MVEQRIQSTINFSNSFRGQWGAVGANKAFFVASAFFYKYIFTET